MKAALDVTEEEYAKAKSSRRLLWICTGIGMVVGVILTFTGILVISLPLVGPMGTPILTGIATHLAAAAMFPDARKMSSNRMRVYPELKAYLNIKSQGTSPSDNSNSSDAEH